MQQKVASVEELEQPEQTPWWVYIVRCADNTLYTGISNDVEKRLLLHTAGKGASYTRGRGPLVLVYCESCGSKSEAAVREYVIKQLTRAQKELLNTAQYDRPSSKSVLSAGMRR